MPAYSLYKQVQVIKYEPEVGKMLSLYLSMVDTEEQRTLIEQLFFDYEQIMFRTAFAVLHKEQDAEDAVHEAFIRIIDNLDKVTTVEHAKRKSYVVIVTRNIAVDMYRRSKKQADMEDISETGDESRDVERDVFGQYNRDTLNAALSQLSDKLREVLILYYYHEETTETIAKMLGISSVAVRTRLFRARKALYCILKDGEKDEK